MAKPTSQSLWSSRGLIVSVRGPGDAQVSLRLAQPFARIGSDRRAEVCLPEGDLLPCHLYLHATEQGIFCLGLSERAPSGWLAPNTRVEVGPYHIKATFADGSPPPAVEAGKLHKKGPLAIPAPVLKVYDPSDERSATEVPLDRPLTVIGRRTPSYIRLSNRAVSRVHCVLYWHDHRLWAIDLLSGNGTCLSEQSVDAALWLPEQELTLGGFRLEYAQLGQPSAAPRSSQPSDSADGAAPSARAQAAPSILAAPGAEPAAAQREGEFPNAPSENRESESAPANPTLSQLVLRVTQLQNQLLRHASPEQTPGVPSASRALACLDAASGKHLQWDVEADPREPNGSGAPAELPAPAEIAQLLLAAQRTNSLTSPGASGAGERPPELLQALAAPGQRALLGPNRAASASAATELAEQASRALRQSEHSPAAFQRFEQELSLVCLTLVKAAQTTAPPDAPRPPDWERLIDAIRSLEDRLARLSPTNGYASLVADGSAGWESPDRSAAALAWGASWRQAALAAPVERQAASSRRGEPPQPSSSRAVVTMSPFDEERRAGVDAAQSAGPAGAVPGAETCDAASHADQLASAGGFLLGPARLDSPSSGQRGRTERRAASPSLKAPCAPQAASRVAERTTGEAEFDSPGGLLDDRMLERLMNFQARRDAGAQRQKIFWSALAAVVVLAIVAATGAAKVWFAAADQGGDARPPTAAFSLNQPD